MKTLQLSFDTAKQLYPTAALEFKTMLEETFTKVKLCPDPVDRIKTVEDCFNEIGFNKAEFDERYKGVPVSVKAFALMTEVIVPALNGGWEPDWDDSDQYKYYPWFEMSGGGFSYCDCDYDITYSTVGARLVYKSKVLAEYAGKQFQEVYKQFMTL